MHVVVALFRPVAGMPLLSCSVWGLQQQDARWWPGLGAWAARAYLGLNHPFLSSAVLCPVLGSQLSPVASRPVRLT
ncbi:hypothetical protein F5144DRAFT_577322 [Chaetomium tenue]|uniref:Uncharacterized protein n=1 Tax=Chaetomium tenue TaxID=1854479 RepID=A0ACB7P7K6_9PEZI|nr:hypothetical protein F5144DRAFT_577322 [Chaetomium globosum]